MSLTLDNISYSSISGYISALIDSTNLIKSNTDVISGAVYLNTLNYQNLSGTVNNITGLTEQINTGNLVGKSETGKFYQNNINNYCNSGNLYQSGSNLINIINGLSGAFNNSGISLQTQINTFNNNTGNLYPFYNPADFSTSGNLYLTGANLFTNDTIISGNLLSLSGDVKSTGNNLFGRLNLLSGNLIQSGINLLGLINGINTGSLTGNFYSISNPNNYSTSNNLTSTGIFVENQLISISGDLITSGRNLENKTISLSGDVSLIRANLISSGTNLGGQLTSLSGDLIFSGRSLDNKTISLSGDVSSIRSNLTLTGINLYNSDSIISGNVTQTGISLLNRLTSLSGDTNLSGQNSFINDTILSGKLINLSGDLIVSGRNLDNKITSFSGDFLSSGNKFIQLSGNLTQTGISILSKITSLSGDLLASGNIFITSGLKWGFTSTGNAFITGRQTGVSLIGPGVGGLTFPSNFFVPGKTVRVRGGGIFTTWSNPTTLKVFNQLAGTIINTTSIFTPTINITTPQGWWMDSVITCRTSGTAGTIFTQGQFNLMNTAAPATTTSAATWMMSNTSTNTIDTTSGLAYNFLGTMVNTGINITGTNFIMEVIN